MGSKREVAGDKSSRLADGSSQSRPRSWLSGLHLHTTGSYNLARGIRFQSHKWWQPIKTLNLRGEPGSDESI